MRAYMMLSRMFADDLDREYTEKYTSVSLCDYHEHDTVTPSECHGWNDEDIV